MLSYWKNIKPSGPKVEDWKNIDFNALPVYDDRYIKSKIITCGDEIYANFQGLDVPKDGV